MLRTVVFALMVAGLLFQSTMVLASQGQVLKVVDGDTFMMEVAGIRGPETIEVNLRCSDAPIISAPFGAESRTYLESLLKESDSIYFKVQAYCGSQSCVEVLAYIPDPLNTDITYINTSMIAAGMARNDSCRGAFMQAEEQAKLAKKGIWSTTKRIVFVEKEKKVTQPQAASKKSITIAQTSAPATIEVNRADRTVTLKSREMSLSKAVAAIDTVSTVPVSLYLIEDQTIALSLDKVAWYKALQQIVDQSNLKQVNMNGKIDLYDQMFYYKYISPYLKLSDNDGVFMNLGGGSKTDPVVDDGVTRYVFVNDFENSATVRRENESQHGFVQVHNGEGKAPVNNDGLFEITDEKKEAVAVAAVEPKAVVPPPVKPSSSKKVGVEPKVPTAVTETVPPAPIEKPPVAVVPTTQQPVSVPVVEKAAEVPPAVTAVPVPSPAVKVTAQQPVPVQPAKDEKTVAATTSKGADVEPVLNIELDLTQAIVLVIVIIVVIVGSIFLSRSAAARAAKAERSVDPSSLGKQADVGAVAPGTLVDEAYEKEIFEELDHVDSNEETGRAVDAIFDKGSEPVEPEVVAEEPKKAEEPVIVSKEPEVPSKQSQAKEDLQEKEPAKVKSKPVQPKVKGLVTDEGNYAVTLDDYERLMKPPKREPRKDCLFEVTCTLDGKSTSGIGLDISSGGMFVDSKENYAVGKVLDVEFILEEGDREPVRCRCGVTWVNERPDPIKPNYPNGYGICFLDMAESTRKSLDDYLALNDDDEIEGAAVDS